MELKEVIATLSDMPDILKLYLDRLDDTQLHFKPKGKYFSVLENICHLRDVDIEGFRVRMRRLLDENNPRLPDVDGNQLAGARHYNQQELRSALDAFIQARYTNLRMLEKLTKTQLARSGSLEPLGKITVSRLLELWVEHDQAHLKELEKLRVAMHEPLVPLMTKPSVSHTRP